MSPRKLSLLLMAMSSTAIVLSQPTFMEIFRATGTAQANLIEMTSGNLLTGMARGRGFSLIDPSGTIIHTQVYVVDTFLAMQSVKESSNNSLWFVGGYYKDTCTAGSLGMITKIYPVIGKMDSLGNISMVHHYALNSTACTNMAGDLEITSDSAVLIWGNRAMFFALKTDHTGMPLWAKRFDERGGFQFIRELPGGDLLAGINMDSAGVVVARMDAEGSFLWCKSYIRPKGMIHDVVIESDDAFVITGFTDSVTVGGGLFLPAPPPFHPKLFMMKLDGTGNVQWCRGYDSEYNWVVGNGSQILRAQDGNYVVLSNLRTRSSARPFLMKTDQNGDTLWTRSSGTNGYHYETGSLLSYSDGSFIYNGRIWGDLPEGQANFAFLYKSDSLGHLPCSEEYHAVQVQDLFPTDSSFTLTSTDGAVRLPAFVQDTIYEPILTYDGCEIVTNIQPIRARSRSFKVFPNPNTGKFTLEFADPLLKESYYSVYDVQGRLLFQRPLPSGASLEQIDLSRIGRGTYVIKFTSPDGVSHQKVVLE